MCLVKTFLTKTFSLFIQAEKKYRSWKKSTLSDFNCSKALSELHSRSYGWPFKTYLVAESNNSSIWIYLVALALSLSKSLGCFQQRLPTNNPGFSVVIMEYNVTPRLRSLILTEMVLYLSMNDHKDSSLAWRRLTKATDVVWWGWLVALLG